MIDAAKVYAVNEAALSLWRDDEGRDTAIDFLRWRGIDASLLDGAYRVGYARRVWTNVTKQLRVRSFSDDELVAAGVSVRARTGQLVDRFRGRIMFPITTSDGAIAGFTGRLVEEGPDPPKYLNTAASDVFNKGALLYGLHEGQQVGGLVPIVVEGPIDALAIAATAFRRDQHDLLPVSACGTSLTGRHAAILASFCRSHGAQPVLAYDGDDAGQSAALRAGEMLYSHGLRPAVAVMPPDVDPADCLALNADLSRFRARPDGSALDLAEAAVTNIITRAHRQWDPDWPETKVSIARAIAAYFGRYPPTEVPDVIGRALTSAANTGGLSADMLIELTRQIAGGKSVSHSDPEIARAHRMVLGRGAT